MPRKIAISTLNASTLDILNTIRENASSNYQSLVPSISQTSEIPKVGEVLVGYPALANEFMNSLINRIAAVRIRSAEFNNAYVALKKGYLEYGETVENVFISLTKAREFSVAKAAAREFQVNKPNVKAEFYTMNYRAQYPVTITDEEFRMAFLSAGAVEDFIARIIFAVTTASEYDEYLLFKYLIIKAVSGGKMYPKAIAADIKSAAVAFRGMSNNLTFVSDKYNLAGVHTTTPKESQYIFMDCDFNAQFDVNVLASAFNMDKADFMGRLLLIDDFTTFDNDRFSEIMTNTDALETVSATELALMANVKAILIDEEWFQVYDNLSRFTEQYVASGLYWNYFYNVWKTVASSSYSNAIVFVDATGAASDMAMPDTITATVIGMDSGDGHLIITVSADPGVSLIGDNIRFVDTQALVTAGVAVHPYGAYIFPSSATTFVMVAELNGVAYTSSTVTIANLAVGSTITLSPPSL